LKALI